jgi:hypothetical protein
VCNQLLRCDVGKSCMPVLQGTEINSGNGAHELLFQGSVNILILLPKVELFRMVANDDSGVRISGLHRNSWRWAWVFWRLKRSGR